MASITIKYTEPVAPVEGEVMQIPALFLPTSSYVDSEPYEGTVWDTNVEGFGTVGTLADYLAKITSTPNVLILFKAAVAAGTDGVTFEETDPKKVQYFVELGEALAEFGFVVTVADGDGDGEASA